MHGARYGMLSKPMAPLKVLGGLILPCHNNTTLRKSLNQNTFRHLCAKTYILHYLQINANKYLVVEINMFEVLEEEDGYEECNDYSEMPKNQVHKLSDTSVNTDDSGQFSANSSAKVKNRQEIMEQLDMHYKSLAALVKPKLET